MAANGTNIRSMADELSVGKSTVARWVPEVSHEAISGSSAQGVVQLRLACLKRQPRDEAQSMAERSDARGEASNKRIARLLKHPRRRLERAFVQ